MTELYKKEIIEIQDHPEGGEIITFQWLSENFCKMQKDRRFLYFCTVYFCTAGKHHVDSFECKLHPTIINTKSYLRTSRYEWYTWPECNKLGLDKMSLEDSYESHHVRLKYAPKTPLKLQPRGNANRCMYCHTDLSGLAAQCLKCGGAMHLDCAKETNNLCQTPGCAPEQEKQRNKIRQT